MRKFVNGAGDNKYNIQFDVDPLLAPEGCVAVLSSLSFVYGEAPNTLVLRIQSQDLAGVEFDNDPYLPVIDPTLTYYITLDGQTFYWRVARYNYFKDGSGRGIDLTLVSPVRRALANQRVSKIYNDFDYSQLDDIDLALGNYVPEWGYYVRDTKMDTPSWKTNSEFGLINARDAILDIFNSVPDPSWLTTTLEFGTGVEDELADFIIPSQSLQEINCIQAMAQILQAAGNYFIYEYCTAAAAGTLVINKYENSASIDLVPKDDTKTFQELYDANYGASKLVATNNSVSYNYDKTVTAIRYRGAKRQYLAVRKRLVPAWDWWNDYKLIVRNARTWAIIPESDWESEGLAWLQTINDAISYDLADTLGSDTESWLNALNMAQSVMDQVVSGYKANIGIQSAASYLINFYALDFVLRPEDYPHLHRFRRFVAIPDVSGEGGGYGYYTGWDTEIDWESDTVRRYRNILPTLVSGRRTSIYSNPGDGEQELSRQESLHVEVPPLVESYMPPAGALIIRQNTNVLGINMTTQDWYRIDPVSVDQKRGFFFIDNPLGKTVFMAPNPTSDPNEVVDPEEKNLYQTKPYFQHSAMVPSDDPNFTALNITKMIKMLMILRAPLRATFYFNELESHLRNPGYDIVASDPAENDVLFAGYVESAGASGIDASEHRFGQSIMDETAVWQTIEGSDSSANVSITYTQSEFVSSMARWTFGRLNTTLAWTQRDDRALLQNRASKALLMEQNREASGNLTGLIPVSIANRSTGFGKITEVLKPDGTPLSDVPIMSVSFSRELVASLQVESEFSVVGERQSRERINFIDISRYFSNQAFSLSKMQQDERRRTRDNTASPTAMMKGNLSDDQLTYSFDATQGILSAALLNPSVPKILVNAMYQGDSEQAKEKIRLIWERYYPYSNFDISQTEVSL